MTVATTLKGCAVDESPALFLLRLFGYLFPEETQFYLFEKTDLQNDLGLPRVVAHNGTHVFDNETIEGYDQEYLTGPLPKYGADFSGGAELIAYIPKHNPTPELLALLFRFGKLNTSPGFALTFLRDYQRLAFSDCDRDLPDILKALPESASVGLVPHRTSKSYFSDYELIGHLGLPCAIRALLETTPRDLCVNMVSQYSVYLDGDSRTVSLWKQRISVFSSMDDPLSVPENLAQYSDARALFGRAVNAIDLRYKMADIHYKDAIRRSDPARDSLYEPKMKNLKHAYFPSFGALQSICTCSSYPSGVQVLQDTYDLAQDLSQIKQIKERIEDEATRLRGQETQAGAGHSAVGQTRRKSNDTALSLLRQCERMCGSAG